MVSNEGKKPRVRRKSKNRRLEKSKKENKVVGPNKFTLKLDEEYIKEKASEYAKVALENCENEAKN